METQSSSASLTRRGFVASGIGAGFALAVQPVSAETIVTDTAGLTAGMVKIKGVDGVEVPAYRAYPTNGKKLPVVLVVQEIFGLHEHIKDVVRRFAKAGYYAIAPELYFRQGDPTKETDFRKIIGEIVSKVPDAQVMSDLDAAVSFAKASRKADVSRLGITGFCWGGRVVWLYAAHNPALKAGAAWYGRVEGAPSPLQPKNPIDLASSIKAPVLGLYGAKDGGIPVASLDRLKDALKAAGNDKCEIIVYPDAEHGFHADYRPSYNEHDAKDGFAKLLAWFKKHGA